jgi:hypothetical protein
MAKLANRMLWNLPVVMLAWNLRTAPAQAQFVQTAKLIAMGAVAQPAPPADGGGYYPVQVGYSVSLSGDGATAIVGGPGDWWGMKPGIFDGAAWVWTYSNGNWGSGTILIAVDGAGAQQGFSVALSGDGNTAIVGGPLDNNNAGAAWVWTRSGGVWTQQQKLIAADAIGPATQGFSVALSGDGNTAIAGGPLDNNIAGAAWVWTRSGGVWTQQQKLIAADAVGLAGQGGSVTLSGDGNTAIIGGRPWTITKLAPRGCGRARVGCGPSKARNSSAQAPNHPQPKACLSRSRVTGIPPSLVVLRTTIRPVPRGCGCLVAPRCASEVLSWSPSAL